MSCTPRSERGHKYKPYNDYQAILKNIQDFHFVSEFGCITFYIIPQRREREKEKIKSHGIEVWRK